MKTTQKGPGPSGPDPHAIIIAHFCVQFYAIFLTVHFCLKSWKIQNGGTKNQKVRVFSYLV